MSDVKELIKQLIKEKFNNQKTFCDKTGFQAGNLSRMLNGKRPITPSTIIELEKLLNVPTGTILMPGQNANYIQGFNEDEKQYAIDPHEIEIHGWNINNLRVINIEDFSLSPDIPINSKLVIDISQTTIKDGALYAIKIGNDVAIRRVSKILGRNLYEIKADNLDYSPQHVTPEDLVILGKAVYLLGKKID